MSERVWDLDSPPPEPTRARRSGNPVAGALAVLLAGLGAGGLAGSAGAPPAAPRFPPAATLSLRDAYVDTSGPAPPDLVTTGKASTTPSGPTNTGTAAPGPQRTSRRAGDAVAVLRLWVENPATGPVRLVSVALDGLGAQRVTLPLGVRLAGRSGTAVDLTVRPDCAAGREPAPLVARLRTGSPGGTAELPVAPARVLGREGGLCALLDSELPHGWRTPLQAFDVHLDGEDLLMTIDDLAGHRLVGILVEGQLLPTVTVGDHVLPASAQVGPGERSRLRLQGTPRCVESSRLRPVPATARLLTQQSGSLEQELVVAGPELTRWLRRSCSRP